jgi:uncharacterized protein (TIGR02996 family)
VTSDLRALLAGIGANPVEDVARLVYADCLEENGNAARAAFIRLQIEAERHHPDSKTRAALEVQARALFEKHWQEWWGEVCAAVGFAPVEPGRYEIARSGTAVREVPPGPPIDNDQWEVEYSHGYNVLGATFRRGFPESLSFTPEVARRLDLRAVLPRWSGASPLSGVLLHGWAQNPAEWWPSGSFLQTISALTFEQYEPNALGRTLQTPHLAHVERLTLRPGYTARGTRGDVRGVLAAPCAPNLKHLTAPVRNAQIAELIAESTALTALESFEVPLGYYDGTGQPLPVLARAPTLARLKHLAVTGPLSAESMNAICRAPVWSRLRSLHLNPGWHETSIYSLASSEELPALEECRITGLQYTRDSVRQLAGAPALKRVRHFALLGGVYNNGHVFLPLGDAVDPARIETFAIGIPYFPERAANALRAKFGDRVRFLPA